MTKTNDKLTITRQLADAIHWYRIICGVSNGGIMRLHFGEPMPISPHSKVICNADTDELMSALTDGYEVEQTPEDKLRGMYDKLHDLMLEDVESENALYYRAKRYGIYDALDILGIEIEGINA